MQKKLREISSIPFLIQSTINQVTQALEKFCPPLPEPEPEPEPELEVVEEVVEELEVEEEEPEADFEITIESLFDESKIVKVILIKTEEEIARDAELEAVLNEENKLRRAKLQKIEKLDRSWPWNGGFVKKIHKRSNCYLVPGSNSSRIQEKIKQLKVEEIFAMQATKQKNWREKLEAEADLHGKTISNTFI